MLIIRELKQKEHAGGATDETFLEEYLPEGIYQLEVSLKADETPPDPGRGERSSLCPVAKARSICHRWCSSRRTTRSWSASRHRRSMRSISTPAGRSGWPTSAARWSSSTSGATGAALATGRCRTCGAATQIRGPAAGDPRASRPVGAVARRVRPQDRHGAPAAVGRARPTLRVLLDRPDPNNHDGSRRRRDRNDVKRYGVTGFPTLFVIDKSGNDGRPGLILRARSPGSSRPRIAQEVQAPAQVLPRKGLGSAFNSTRLIG